MAKTKLAGLENIQYELRCTGRTGRSYFMMDTREFGDRHYSLEDLVRVALEKQPYWDSIELGKDVQLCMVADKPRRVLHTMGIVGIRKLAEDLGVRV